MLDGPGSTKKAGFEESRGGRGTRVGGVRVESELPQYVRGDGGGKHKRQAVMVPLPRWTANSGRRKAAKFDGRLLALDWQSVAVGGAGLALGGHSTRTR